MDIPYAMADPAPENDGMIASFDGMSPEDPGKRPGKTRSDGKPYAGPVSSEEEIRSETGRLADALKPGLVPDPEPVFITEKKPMPAYLGFEEAYKIDCVWVQYYDYYAIWETNKLNPYGIDGEQFADTVGLMLYDPGDSLAWHSPLDRTTITSDFGLRRAAWHYGVDFRLRTGTPVYAAFDGVVRIMGYDRYGFGRFIVLRHRNGLETVYGHLQKSQVRVGQVVKAGQVIGAGGNTGRSTAPHLHFEIRYAGNAIDPHLIYDFKANTIRRQSFTVDPGVFAYLEEANKIRYHVIRSGDTLSGIGYRYGVSVNKLCALNGIRRTTILRIGRRLRIN